VIATSSIQAERKCASVPEAVPPCRLVRAIRLPGVAGPTAKPVVRATGAYPSSQSPSRLVELKIITSTVDGCAWRRTPSIAIPNSHEGFDDCGRFKITAGAVCCGSTAITRALRQKSTPRRHHGNYICSFSRGLLWVLAHSPYPSSCTLLKNSGSGFESLPPAAPFLIHQNKHSQPRRPTFQAFPAISLRSQPVRYSRRSNWPASRQLVTRKSFGSHSIRWPVRRATLPS